MAKTLKELTAQEMLALAIQAEEEDGRIYADLAERIGADYPDTAKSLRAMRDEEDGHRHRLIELYRQKFGEHIPLIRRQDVQGFYSRKPLWLTANLTVPLIRAEIETMEDEARKFYELAIARTSDAAVRQLLGDLAAEESKHYDLAEEMDEAQKKSGARDKEDDSAKRKFVLQIIQPGLAGLMDGSVSTLAPVFAAAFATHASWTAFLVGMAASIGAGISMGFAEALSDDGVLSGRGHPWLRGPICGAMTTAGGIGHTLPFLITNFHVAMTIAVIIDDPVEEFFYQLKGDMILKVAENGTIHDVRINEGDIFMLPAHMRHSPQRPMPGSVGLVVESARRADDVDAFEWFCFGCGARVHRVEVKVTNIVKDLPPLFNAFYADDTARTCRSCGTVHPGKQPPAGWAEL